MHQMPKVNPKCAETEHESVRALAASLLAMGSKQEFAALGPGFRVVASAATRRPLPLRVVPGPERQPRHPASWVTTWPIS